MASPKSAKVVSCDAPDAPEDALEAGTDDAGEMAEIEASRAEQIAAAPAAVTVGAMAQGGGDDPEEEEEEKTWVAFRLLGADGEPLEGEPMKLVVDGEEESAQTDDNGEVKKEEIDKGPAVKVHLEERFDCEWEKVDVETEATAAAGQSVAGSRGGPAPGGQTTPAR